MNTQTQSEKVEAGPPAQAEAAPQTEAADPPPETAPAAVHAAPGSSLVEAVGDGAEAVGVLQLRKMTRQLLLDTSTLTQAAVGTAQTLADGLGKLQTTLAAVARQVATTEVRTSEGLLETRRLISTEFESLKGRQAGEHLERVLEHLLLTTLLPVVDDVDVVLREAAKNRKERGTASCQALRMVRDRLLFSMRAYEVEVTPITPGATLFDEALHECQGSETENLVGRRVIVTEVYRQGYRFRGRIMRRAHVVVKGA